MSSSNDKHNRLGLVGFIVVFAASVIFFVYIVMKTPGTIDAKPPVQAVALSHEEILVRDRGWRQATPDSIALGKELYAVNCAFCHTQDGKDIVMKKYETKGNRYGIKQIDLYKTIAKGMPEIGHKKMDYIPAASRWAIVNYIRSLLPEPGANSDNEWQAFEAEGIW
jgi:mono/diheme cytochrome c family protein